MAFCQTCSPPAAIARQPLSLPRCPFRCRLPPDIPAAQFTGRQLPLAMEAKVAALQCFLGGANDSAVCHVGLQELPDNAKKRPRLEITLNLALWAAGSTAVISSAWNRFRPSCFSIVGRFLVDREIYRGEVMV